MFAALGRGGSMLPGIADGTRRLFHPDVAGTRQDRIVLVEDRNNIAAERYALNKPFAPQLRARPHTSCKGRQVSHMRLARRSVSNRPESRCA